MPHIIFRRKAPLSDLFIRPRERFFPYFSF